MENQIGIFQDEITTTCAKQ